MDSNTSDRAFLLEALAGFICDAHSIPGVLRFALPGSLTTDDPSPEDADGFIDVEEGVEMAALARLGRELRGGAQTRHRGADIFPADFNGSCIGRTCGFRECHSRQACRGTRCQLDAWSCDGFDVVRIADTTIAEPPLEVWPRVLARTTIPSDTRTILLGQRLRHAGSQGAV